MTLITAACGGDDSGSPSASSAVEETSATTAASGGSTSVASDATTTPPSDAPTTIAGEGTDGILTTVHGLTAGFTGTFDPAASNGGCDALILRPIYDSLVRIDPTTGEALPGLAESWKLIDPSTIDFTIRQGALFQDGQPFDAAAVKAGLDHNVAGAGAIGAALSGLIAGVEVVDDHTVRITTKTQSAASLPLIFSGREGMIVAPGADAATNPVGAGPFKYDSYVPGQELSLRRADNYYDVANVKLAGIDIANTDGGPSMVSGIRAGDIDLTEIAPDLIAGLEDDPNVTIVRGTDARTYVNMSMNLGVPPFNNEAFRQAVSYAIDRDAILQAAFLGEGTVAWGPFPEGAPGYDPSTTDHYKRDVDKAKQLITESGLSDLSFTAISPPYPAYQRVGQIMQQNLAEVGITMNLQDSTQVVQDFYTDKKAQGFIAIASATPDPSDSISRRFTPGSFLNPGGYSNDELTALLAKIDTTSDEAERADLLRQASVIVVDEALDLPLVYQYNLRAYRNDRIRGDVVPYESCLGVDWTKLWVKSD